MGESPSGKKYIGQHNTEDFRKRKRGHIDNYIKYIKNRCINELHSKFNITAVKLGNNCSYLYNAFMKHGYLNFKWTILEKDIPKEKLNEREDYYIKLHNTLCPLGYNLKMNSTHDGIHKYSDESRKKMSESSKKKVKDNLHKYRRNNEELKDVPQHVTYFESKGLRGYRIVDHPKCQSKQFADYTTPIAELKRQLLEFLNQCEAEPFKTVQQRKALTGVPKGISEQKPGRFLVQFRYKGIRYDKFFYVKDDRDQSLKLAIEWMNKKKAELKSKELNNSSNQVLPQTI